MVVVVNAGSFVKRLRGIFRIRTELEAIAVYFDSVHVVRKVGALTDLGVVLP